MGKTFTSRRAVLILVCASRHYDRSWEQSCLEKYWFKNHHFNDLFYPATLLSSVLIELDRKVSIICHLTACCIEPSLEECLPYGDHMTRLYLFKVAFATIPRQILRRSRPALRFDSSQLGCPAVGPSPERVWGNKFCTSKQIHLLQSEYLFSIDKEYVWLVSSHDKYPNIYGPRLQLCRNRHSKLTSPCVHMFILQVYLPAMWFLSRTNKPVRITCVIIRMPTSHAVEIAIIRTRNVLEGTIAMLSSASIS